MSECCRGATDIRSQIGEHWIVGTSQFDRDSDRPPRPPPSGPGLYIFGAPDLMRGGCRLDVPLRNNSGDLGWANRPNGTHWQ